MWELEYKESWEPKNWCFWTVVLEKTLESPLDCKEIKPVSPKGDQSWIFIVGTDVGAETSILRPPDVKSWLIGKDPDAGKDWGQEEKGTTEDEMVRWHHWLNGHGFGWTLGVGDGQGGLACCGSWGHKESDTTEQQQQRIYSYICSSYNGERRQERESGSIIKMGSPTIPLTTILLLLLLLLLLRWIAILGWALTNVAVVKLLPTFYDALITTTQAISVIMVHLHGWETECG